MGEAHADNRTYQPERTPMPKSIEKLVQTITQQLLPAYGQLHMAEQNAWYLLEKATGLMRTSFIAHPEYTLTPKQNEKLMGWVKEIVENSKPIQYILGTVPFLDLTIQVMPPVLIPRPETEEWCATLIEYLKRTNLRELTILDLCTGSGCIALALAQAFPKSTIYASDISPQAIALAQKNADLNHISNVTFTLSDLYTEYKNIKFDFIVANPPYIAPEEYNSLDASVAQWEDPQALVAQDHGLKIIHKIIQEAPRFLKKPPLSFPQVWIEIGYQQGLSVSDIFKKYNFEPNILKDLYKNDRVVNGILKK